MKELSYITLLVFLRLLNGFKTERGRGFTDEGAWLDYIKADLSVTVQSVSNYTGVCGA